VSNVSACRRFEWGGEGQPASHYAVRILILALCLFIDMAAPASDLAQDAELHGDIEVGVSLDKAEQAGTASATVRIHAPRDVVWSLITDCTEALDLVPGLVACDVLETAPDGSWQRIHHVLDYSWYIRKLTYEVRATYDKPVRVSIERVSGDLKTLTVSWKLQQVGDDTIAQYTIDLAPGFWVPHWLVRVALKRDLPKMLRALRARAESVAHP
jgi:carbon monoxide dehydrogenase subunit G